MLKLYVKKALMNPKKKIALVFDYSLSPRI
jgi:hypothetical protein